MIVGELEKPHKAAKKAPQKAAKKAPQKAAKKAPHKAAKKAPHKAAKKAPKKAPHKAAKTAPHKAAKKPPHKAAKGSGTSSADAREAQSTTSDHATESPKMRLAELAAHVADPSTVLGVREGCSALELRRAWRRFASQHHPDQGGDPGTFTRGRHAYEALMRATRKR